jgi:hypothetical protein
MAKQDDIDAINALPLSNDARARALARIEMQQGSDGTPPELTAAIQQAVKPGRRNVTPQEIAATEATRADVAAFEAGEPGTGMKAPDVGYTGGRVGAQSPVTQAAVAEAAEPPPVAPEIQAPVSAGSTLPQSAFNAGDPRSAGPRLPTTLGLTKPQGPVQVTQDLFKTGIATPEEQHEGETRIERMGQAEGDIAAAQQERAFQVAELDRGEAEQQRRLIESQQVAQEEKFLLDLETKQSKIDEIRERRSAVPKGERKIEGFWDNAGAWLNIFSGDAGGKVIDQIADKEITKYDRERSLLDDEAKLESEDFDRILAAQPSRRAAMELQKTVKFGQIARRLDQELSKAGSDEQSNAIMLARDHAMARAQESRLKWRQAYGDTSTTQVSRTTAQPVTPSLITPAGIGEARKMSAEERFRQALEGEQQTEATREGVKAGEIAPPSVLGGPTEKTEPDKSTRTALGLPEPKPITKAANPKYDPSGAPQVQKETPPDTGKSLAAQEGEDAAAHYDRIAQDPGVRNFLSVMTKKYESSGVPSGRAWIRALNDASGANYFGEPTSQGEHSDLKKSVTVNGKKMFAPDASRAASYEKIINDVELARDGIADWHRYSSNAGRKIDAGARTAAAIALNKFNGLIEATTAGGVLSPAEIEQRKSILPDAATFTDVTQFNAALAKAWSGLAEIIENRVMTRLTLDPEGRYPAQQSSGFQRTE